MPPAVDLFDGRYKACLFDMDGVLTNTATVHASAWKFTFDEVLQRFGVDKPFDPIADYLLFVDGKPRNDGVRSFLKSRGIDLPEGTPDDEPGFDSVWAVGNRKNEQLLKALDERGVDVYDSSVQLVRALKAAGLKTAVVSASANTPAVLESAGIADLFDVRIDGNTIIQEHLRGKPEPDTFLRAAKELGVDPAVGVVFEDALAGVQSGCRGHFGLTVGVDRAGQAQALRENGADVVVQDLGELLPATAKEEAE